MPYVLDASAVLAGLLGEAGADRVGDALGEAIISAVNWAEVAGELRRRGEPMAAVEAVLDALDLPVIAADEAMALAAADLRPVTERAGLSLGDRFCLALARRTASPVLTADRNWAGIAEDPGVTVELIR
jgi:PIN domain nuclease of toxin-antitoxin system